MKDRNGVEIVVGARAIPLKAAFDIAGKIGEVRAIAGNSVRVSMGPEDRFHWSTWSKPRDITIVSPPPPSPGIAGEE